MIGIVGIVIIFVTVFGGYMLHGGKLGIVLEAAPWELIMIGGAAAGAFVLANDMAAIKQTMRDVGKVFKGAKWKPGDYRDLLCLLFELIRMAKSNPVAARGTYRKSRSIGHLREAIRRSSMTMRLWN